MHMHIVSGAIPDNSVNVEVISMSFWIENALYVADLAGVIRIENTLCMLQTKL